MIDPAPSPARDDEEPLPAEWLVRKSLWVRFRERTHSNWPLTVGAMMLTAYCVVGIAAIVEFGSGLYVLPIDPNYANVLTPPGPGSAHPFGIMGTIGVDILSALFQATPIDLALIGGSTLLAVAIGLLLGAYAGLVGGPVDLAVTFCSDLLTTVPPFFFVMVLFLGLQPFLKPPSFLIVFGLLYALVLWPYHARPVRARALQVAGETYVEAARAAGGTTGRLLRRHVIPNSVFPLLAQVPVDIYNFMFVLTVFPFLGLFAGSLFGYLTPLPATVYPEWGYLLAAGVTYGWSPLTQINHWWMYGFPAAVVVLFGISVALFCDGLERLLAGARQTR
ncbi:MAG TPA: ABC transporter permease [Thermoplasmata archaeon]|nr:ABC transporter permease [Thermoplasmata archaeon]